MKLQKDRSRLWLIPIVIMIFGVSFTWGFRLIPKVFASSSEEPSFTPTPSEFFVSVFDDDKKTIVKTSAATVRELLSRLGTTFSDYDTVEPGLDTVINSDNFFINIFRARPVVLKDGSNTKYIMTASHDTRTIFEDAGITVYDGDKITPASNNNLLEVGMAEAYAIQRNGGRRITTTEEIPFTEESVKDYNIPTGNSEVRQLGVTGSKTLIYEVNYVDGKEVSRSLVSAEVTKEPVPRITAVGAKPSVRPEWETCAAWVRQAGISESEVSIALTLIYRESGCRVDARNSSTGAYGIPQALPGSKMASSGSDWETNPVTQIRWMTGYVTGRYGGWRQALEFWDAHHWY